MLDTHTGIFRYYTHSCQLSRDTLTIMNTLPLYLSECRVGSLFHRRSSIFFDAFATTRPEI